MPLLKETIMLNISKKDLTEKTLQNIIDKRRSGDLKALKSVMIGQNKIQERKNKAKI